jgi:hypothetical protein
MNRSKQAGMARKTMVVFTDRFGCRFSPFRSGATLAAKRATNTMPIVVAGAGDLVGEGLVASLARPGGNTTGFTNQMA